MDQEFVKSLKEKHIAAWNERDRTRRDSILREIYHDNIRMYDPNIVFHSLTEISDLIGKLHSDDPYFYFAEARPVDFSHNGVRLFGIIGTKEERVLFNTMDFFLIEQDKVANLYVFMSPVG